MCTSDFTLNGGLYDGQSRFHNTTAARPILWSLYGIIIAIKNWEEKEQTDRSISDRNRRQRYQPENGIIIYNNN